MHRIQRFQNNERKLLIQNEGGKTMANKTADKLQCSFKVKSLYFYYDERVLFSSLNVLW